MGIKITKEREMLSPRQLDAIVDLAVVGNCTISARQREWCYPTLKNALSTVYDKVEDRSGTRPSQANVVLYFIFGRFLSDTEVRHLIEGGELHDWAMDYSKDID